MADSNDVELQGLSGPVAEALERLRRLVVGLAPNRPAGPGRRDLAEALADLASLAAEQQARHEEVRLHARRMEDAYEETREQLMRYRELFEFAPDAYLVTDLSGVIGQANHAATLLLQSAKEFLLGKPLPFFVAEEERRPFYSQLTKLIHLGAGSVRAWEVRLKPRKAPPVEAAVTVTVDADAQGRPAGLRWLVRDVTARKRAEESLRAEKEFADSLVDGAQFGVLVLNSAGAVLRANAYLESLSGLGRDDLLGRDWCAALIDGPDQEGARQALARALAAREGARAVYGVRTRDNRLRSVLWSVKRLATPEGRPRLVLAVGHDITDLQQAQEQALRMERLAAIGQMVTGLAHESRNALQRVQACLEMLRWKLAGRPDALDLVARTQKAQQDLLHLYEDVRNYAVPIQLRSGLCDLGEVWREVWAQLTSLCPERDVQLAEETAGVDLVCAADRFRLAQVFRNVLENALAACPGPVRVVVACTAADLAGRPALRVAVRDNGPGLTAEHRRRLFEPFYTTKVKGTGLGMAIAKRIIEAHGGDITAGGPPGGGAEIIFLLPRDTP